MHKDYTKICRVCMSEGSRDIFPKKLTASAIERSSSPSTSPLERLLEKLRYVTMMKIDENDDLPRLLCDLCIVQLNVAYNFKRQAVENDTKLRQYFIENGISTDNNQTAGNNDTASTRSSFTTTMQLPIHRNFPIMPFIVKTEPADIDGFSDATVETNLEHVSSNTPIDRLNLSNTTTTSSISQNNHQNIYNNKESCGTSMVYVNGYSANSVTPVSDVEFIQNSQTKITNDINDESYKNFTTNENFNISSAVDEMDKRHCNSENITHGLSCSRNLEHKEKNRSHYSYSNKPGRKKNSEIYNLAIDMNFFPPTTDTTRNVRKNEKFTGKTIRASSEKINSNGIDKLEKNVGQKKLVKRQAAKMISSTEKQVKNSSEKKSAMLINPFSSKQTKNNNVRLLNRMKTVTRKKRLSEKVLRPKIDPPTKSKLNTSK